ncbi:M56 family metallopeptidase [Neolewinella lacunae]|uniref:Peptidase M56 domain-containing protein n=1 Tax=Neolewinella lacunae TaxID=1517758 RepID=A0A923PNU0_9BACT|nr:M56 family metallopeptidase [Neolewinella lacunae]MBC6994668.1 hypothetical protein [Neolewinella lacunae]MDN3634540.1 M56 family metallopeptidase [Neolewinella lacunae]
MSAEILEYLLRATVIWLALLAYYFAFGRSAGFRFQRFLLLLGWVFGLVVPLLPAIAVGAELSVIHLPALGFTPRMVTAEASETATVGWYWVDNILPLIYLLGVLIFGARTLVQGWSIKQCLRNGERSTFNGYPVIRSSRIEAPFADRGYVFLPAALTDAELTYTALIHETAHLRQRHHYDKYLLTLGSIFLWFHPLAWAYRRLLATVHEYEADAAVLQWVPARIYGLQLLHCALGPAGKLGLFSSPLKKRIEMITNKNRERKLRIIPLLGLCLLLAGLAVACSDVAEVVVAPITENQVRPYDPTQGDTYLVDDPQSPLLVDGKLDRIIADVYQRIKYPEAARKAGLTGKFRILVSADETGKVNFITVNNNSDKAAAEITVVGYGTPIESDDAQPEILAEEVYGLFLKRQLPDRYTKDGNPAEILLALDFVFKLE